MYWKMKISKKNLICQLDNRNIDINKVDKSFFGDDVK